MSFAPSLSVASSSNPQDKPSQSARPAPAEKRAHGHHQQQQPSEPLSASNLLEAHHGSYQNALDAAIAAHNSLLSAESEKTRVVAENSKLWTWCSGLKRERDSLFKDRTRLERKLADLQAFCRAQGLEPLDDAEDDLANSSTASRPGGPTRSRSGEVLLREAAHSTNRDHRTQTPSSSTPAARSPPAARAKTDADVHLQQDGARHRNQSGGSVQPGSSSASAEPPSSPPSASKSPNQGHGLRRKASSVDLGNPSSTSTRQQHHHHHYQQREAGSSTPPRAASTVPRYTLNGLEVSQSPFAPTFNSAARRASSIVPSSPTVHDAIPGPSHAADDSVNNPAMMSMHRSTRSPSDSIATTASERSKLGLQSFSPVSSSSSPPPPALQDTSGPKLSPVKANSLPPEPTDSAEEPFERGPPTAQWPDHSPTKLTPSSSLSSNAMLASPEFDRSSALNQHTGSPLRGKQPVRPLFQSAPSNDSQASDKQRAASAPSPGHGSDLSQSQPEPPSTRATMTMVNFRLDPESLQHCKIRVNSSQIKTNDKAREVILFFITVSLPIEAESSPTQEKATAHWTIEKYYSDVLQLDAAVKGKHSKSLNKKIANVPDKSLFKDHAPSKVDLRKAVLQKYLRSLAAVDLDVKDDVCHFLTTNVVDERNTPVANPAYKAGYLTKKGRLIGGWQTRYYALQGPFLEYYESQGGPRLGQIDVTGAQIGRQQTSKDLPSNDTYRHAFLIRENRRSKSTDAGTDVDHILCAESDTDRDEWVRVLAAWATGEYIQPSATFVAAPEGSQETPASGSSVLPSTRPPLQTRNSSRDEGIKTLGAGHSQNAQSADTHGQKFLQKPFAVPQDRHHHREDSTDRASVTSEGSLPPDSEPPLQQRVLRKRPEHSANDIPSSSSFTSGLDNLTSPRPSSQQSHHAESAPSSQSSHRPASPAKIATGKISGPMNGAPINAANFKAGRQDRATKVKSSFWGFARGDKNPPVITVQRQPVFGVPLEEAVNRCRVRDGFELPAVVYRCVEYLQAKEAVKEEGLYRLSGSSTVIKGLKEKFDTEGDYNLLASGQYHDPHAVAGLLKLFLRELPVSVLTRELHPYFLRVVDLAQRKDKVNELGVLVAQLPVANYTLLRFLSSHLTHVIQNEPINKMSLRNIGIVFSPTLAIPATLFNLFLTEFPLVFRTLDDQPAPVRLEDEDVDEPNDRVVSADMSVETITEAGKNRRKSRNSQYYSLSGADLLLEPDAARLNEAAERETEDEDCTADSEHESANSQHRSPLPSPTLPAGTAPSSVSSESGDHNHSHGLPLPPQGKNKTMFINTSGVAPSSGLPASPNSRFLSSPRHMATRQPPSPH